MRRLPLLNKSVMVHRIEEAQGRVRAKAAQARVVASSSGKLSLFTEVTQSIV
jgi:hypothetical protein